MRIFLSKLCMPLFLFALVPTAVVAQDEDLSLLAPPSEVDELLGFWGADSVSLGRVAPPTGSPSEVPIPPSPGPTEAPTESPAPSPSPSETPTLNPTDTDPPTLPPTAESAAPTESPAPSPSPSETPTQNPTQSPSEHPTMNPTVSLAPSSIPSDAPTSVPSASPSSAPSAKPSLSQIPSDAPSNMPTGEPSANPSAAPSMSPTASPQPSSIPSDFPSLVPSSQPSAAPTKAPTNAPSQPPTSPPSMAPTTSPTTSPPTGAPSGAPTTLEPSAAPSTRPTVSAFPSTLPTDASFKMREGITNVLLFDIEKEMGDKQYGIFEVKTLEFIRNTQPNTDGSYELDILAVTVMTQRVVYLNARVQDDDPEAVVGVAEGEEGEGEGGERKLKKDDPGGGNPNSKVALQVSFRTVGVVTEGRAPEDLVFTDITDYGFANFYNQYLFELGNSDKFFEALKDVSKARSASLAGVVGANKSKKGQFVAAILCSILAFVVAVCASVYAVRKHLDSTKRITDKSRMLEYPGYVGGGVGVGGTHSDSEDSDDDEDAEKSNSGSKTLQLSVHKENIELEDVGLSPSAMTSPFSGCIRDECTPKSPSAMENGGNKRSSFGVSETSSTLKKWLTPRLSAFQFTPDSRSDPPDSHRSDTFISGVNTQSVDPDALKASTTNMKGVLSDERKTIAGSKKEKKQAFEGNTPLGIPMSFFSRDSDAKSETTATPMSGLAESSASSFFMKVGRSVFTGGKGRQSEAGASFTAATEKYTFGSTGGNANAYNKGNDSDTSQKPDLDSRTTKKVELNAANLAKLQVESKQQIKPSQHGVSGRISTFEALRTREESATSSVDSPPNDGNADKDLEQKGGKRMSRDDIYDHDKQDSATENRTKRTRTFDQDQDSVYSEQSEFELNDIPTGTLGARAPKPLSKSYDQDSLVSDAFGQGSNFRNPSTIGARSQTSYNHPTGSTGQQPSYTLGARPLPETDQNQRSSLGSLAKKAGSYDVFAPSGPIGIVVDTSKEGPAVHSLKSTSPMLGLINPGDLIVALDDEDTRTMTAAALTRLMAKKSRQKERKITLLAMDGF